MNDLNVVVTTDEPSFASFSEAVDAVRKSPRHIASRITSKEIAGAVVLDFAFGFSWLNLALSGNRGLRLYLHGGIVCWDVQSPRNGVGESDAATPLPE